MCFKMLIVMADVKLCFVFILPFILVGYEVYSDVVQGIEAIPERAELVYSNEKYVINATVNVRRYSRRGAYMINFWGYNYHTWGNNVTIDVVFYEYLHNEYKRSFVELHYKLCDLIKKDDFIGPGLRELGLKCPLDKGPNGLLNVSMSFPKFPYVFPFQKCRTEIVFKTEPSHDIIGKGYIYLTIKQYTVKSNKN